MWALVVMLEARLLVSFEPIVGDKTPPSTVKTLHFSVRVVVVACVVCQVYASRCVDAVQKAVLKSRVLRHSSCIVYEWLCG